MLHLTIQKYRIMHRSIASGNNKFHELYTLAFRSNSHYITNLNLYSWNCDVKNSLLGTYSCATNNDLSFSIQCWHHITKQNVFQIYAAVFTSRPCLFRIVFRWHPRCTQISRCIFAVCRHAQLPWKFKCVVRDGILNKYSIPCRLGTNSACPVPKKYRFFQDSVGSRSIQSKILQTDQQPWCCLVTEQKVKGMSQYI